MKNKTAIIVGTGLGLAVVGTAIAISKSQAQASPAPPAPPAAPVAPPPIPGQTAIKVTVSYPMSRIPRVYVDGRYVGDGSFLWVVLPGQHVVSFEPGAAFTPTPDIDHYVEPASITVNVVLGQTITVNVVYTAIAFTLPDIYLVSIAMDTYIVLDYPYIITIIVNNPTNTTNNYYAEILLDKPAPDNQDVPVYGGGPLYPVPPGSWSYKADFKVFAPVSIVFNRHVWIRFYAINKANNRILLKVVDAKRDIILNPPFQTSGITLPKVISDKLGSVVTQSLISLVVWQNNTWRGYIPNEVIDPNLVDINNGDRVYIVVLSGCTIISTGRKLLSGGNDFIWP